MWNRMMVFAVAAMAAVSPARANAPVPALALDRYLGRWHEIAHLPMFFQRKCVGDITADYALLPDGDIQVRNGCRTKDGTRDEAIGVARPVDGAPGALKVRFAPKWLSWLPGVWADYWVVAVDPDYRWAMVGGPDRKHLWILSRTPSMDRARFDALVADARRLGYPIDRLVVAAPLTPD